MVGRSFVPSSGGMVCTCCDVIPRSEESLARCSGDSRLSISLPTWAPEDHFKTLGRELRDHGKSMNVVSIFIWRALSKSVSIFRGCILLMYSSLSWLSD